MDWNAVAIVLGTFFFAGTVKGVVGLGLPTLSLAVLTATLDLTTAMALLIVPSMVTNLWQAFVGGHAGEVLRRTWPFLAMATATVWLGALALTTVSLGLLSALLGALMAAYAAISLSGFRLTIPAHKEVWVAPALGAVNGVFAGMTGAFAVPGVMYLQAIGLPRDSLVQAMGILFAASTVALGLALGRNGLMTTDIGLVSAAAVAPAVIGMMVGQRIRRGISETRFRQVFFIAILVLGIFIIAKAALFGYIAM